jgi:hypothetical protein
MQHDVRLSAAALEILAGTAWAWIIAARISRLAELAQSLLWGAAGEPTGMNIASRRRDLVKAVFLGLSRQLREFCLVQVWHLGAQVRAERLMRNPGPRVR